MYEEKQISKEKEKIKNLDFAVNNIISDYNLLHGTNNNNNINKRTQQDGLSSFPNLNTSSFSFDNINFGFDNTSSNYLKMFIQKYLSYLNWYIRTIIIIFK